MPKLQRLSLSLLVLTLAGCAAQRAREADAPYLAEAGSRLRAADYVGASQIYQQLADSSNAPDYYRLQAADAELRGGNNRMAQALISGIDEGELERADRYRLLLLKSRIDLNQGRAREAMARLDQLTDAQLEPASRAHYHTLRASAYNQLGKMVESARERVYLGQLLSSPEAIQKNNEAIYDTLGHVPDAALAGMREPNDYILGGWLALSQAARAPVAQRVAALQTWRAQYPGHPANGAFVGGLTPKQAPNKTIEIKPLKAETPAVQAPQPPAEAAAATGSGGHFIAVLLPLSGNYAPAGQALRAGIEAARSADSNPAKPELRFVDAQGPAVAEQYRQATSEGAEFVIGPLLKEDVAALAQSGELGVPVLALNQNPDVSQDKLYQFGLTPEQEVEQSAGSAWFDGRQSALVLAPASSFGQRMIAHFSTYWKSLGGRLATVKTYQPGGNDFAQPVQELLANQTQSGGADFVFLIADPRDARLLKPQLDSQLTSPLPVYATSHTYSGRSDASLDKELNGVIFCDAPWLLNTTDTGPLSRQGLQGALQQTPETYTRLIAMGVDAYNLVPRLGQLKSSPPSRYNGATGTLNLLSGNRIQRQLHCAQFENGTLQPRGIAPLLQPGAAPAAGAQ
ncbi:penicillin-binding protein activator [Methylococcus sp. EFPC2]|uniref:penicillin-binding protein activator n=1 Tax=Methylococcus sp. EFPC2 TaxID=2812648 RepID=UPI00196871C3|nr:penicillin-binding protein activator [Methylococcus sp. EFPC2]QSA97052.1 penicillin-binding protein activator [Methylococcus sp. EFPC2]